MAWISPVDSVEHIAHLCRRDSHHTIGWRGPYKATLLQTFGIQRHADTVVPKNLYQIASRTPEYIEIAGMWIPAERFLNLQREPLSCHDAYPSARLRARHARWQERQSSPLQRVQHDAQRCGFDVATDPDAVTAR